MQPLGKFRVKPPSLVSNSKRARSDRDQTAPDGARNDMKRRRTQKPDLDDGSRVIDPRTFSFDELDAWEKREAEREAEKERQRKADAVKRLALEKERQELRKRKEERDEGEKKARRKEEKRRKEQEGVDAGGEKILKAGRDQKISWMEVSGLVDVGVGAGEREDKNNIKKFKPSTTTGGAFACVRNGNGKNGGALDGRERHGEKCDRPLVEEPARHHGQRHRQHHQSCGKKKEKEKDHSNRHGHRATGPAHQLLKGLFSRTTDFAGRMATAALSALDLPPVEAYCSRIQHLVPKPFPFPQALNPQRQIMLRVIRAGKFKQHALLESPTGTGKTMALLCSALAFQRAQSPGARPQIIYGVRTHAQAGQVLKELKRSPYGLSRAVVLGSRAQLCNNPAVAKKFRVPACCSSSKAGGENKERPSWSIDYECRSIKSACPQYLQLKNPAIASFVDAQKDSQSLHESDLDKGSFRNLVPPLDAVDIEDLKTKIFPGCSYYASHVLAGAADIVICPHNYILDPAIARCSTGHRRNWSLENRFVILDEAHNVEELCRDVGSFKLSWEEFEALRKNLEKIAKWAERSNGSGRGSRTNSNSTPSRGAPVSSSSKSKLQTLAGALELREWLKVLAAALPASGKFGLGYPKTTEDLISENFRGKRYKELTGMELSECMLAEAEPFVPTSTSKKEGSSSSTTTNKVEMNRDRQDRSTSDFLLASLSTVDRVQSLLERLRRLIEQPQCYVVKIDGDTSGTTSSTTSSSHFGTLCVFCMSAAAVIAPLASQVDSLILASGTLHPHDALVSELGEVFAARLQRKPLPLAAPHVISKDRFLLVPYVGTKYLGRGASSWAKAAGAAPFSFVRNMNARAVEVEQQAEQQRQQFFPSTGSNTGITAEALADENFLEVIGRQILLTLLRSVPGGSGVLLFLPNTKTVERAMRLWRDKVLSGEKLQGNLVRQDGAGIISNGNAGTEGQTNKVKEPTAYDGLPFRSRIVLLDSLGEFRASVSNPQVITVLVSAYRSSASEGMDFRDSLCRLVVCVGIPFAPYKDEFVEEKKRYNDAAIACLGTESSSREWQHPRHLSGSEWYLIQAYKAICQAAGRVIRHEKDYGCVVLFDGRWTGELLKKRLCAWLQQYSSGSGSALGTRVEKRQDHRKIMVQVYSRLSSSRKNKKAKGCGKRLSPEPAMRLYVWLNSMNTGAGQERKFLAPRSSAAVDNNMPAAQATCESRPGGCVEGAAGASDFLDVAMAGDPASFTAAGSGPRIAFTKFNEAYENFLNKSKSKLPATEPEAWSGRSPHLVENKDQADALLRLGFVTNVGGPMPLLDEVNRKFNAEQELAQRRVQERADEMNKDLQEIRAELLEPLENAYKMILLLSSGPPASHKVQNEDQLGALKLLGFEGMNVGDSLPSMDEVYRMYRKKIDPKYELVKGRMNKNNRDLSELHAAHKMIDKVLMRAPTSGNSAFIAMP
eukprot:g18480.t1